MFKSHPLLNSGYVTRRRLDACCKVANEMGRSLQSTECQLDLMLFRLHAGSFCCIDPAFPMSATLVILLLASHFIESPFRYEAHVLDFSYCAGGTVG